MQNDPAAAYIHAHAYTQKTCNRRSPCKQQANKHSVNLNNKNE